MKILTAIFLLGFACSLNAQKVKEFEGIIKYQHKIRFTTDDVDTSALKKIFGTSSTFYYKNGNYKWLHDSGFLEAEYFDSKSQVDYLEFRNNDTLFRNKTGDEDSLMYIRKIDQKISVGGYLCNVIETAAITKAADGTDLVIKRILSYSDSLALDYNKFSGYRFQGSNKIFRQIKSWPLKFEAELGDLPLVLIYEAVEVITAKLMDVDVSRPTNRPMADRH